MSNPLTDKPEGEPLEVVAGDTWTWKRSDLAGDYPQASYSLSYALKRDGSADAPLVITASEVSNVYEVIVAAATTAPLPAGGWRWDAFMTRTSDSARVRIGSGPLTVLANTAASTADLRSHGQKMLTQIEALLEGRALKDVNSYSIKDRSLTKMSADELMRWRDYYKREVNREKLAEREAQGRPTGRTAVARFDA